MPRATLQPGGPSGKRWGRGASSCPTVPAPRAALTLSPSPVLPLKLEHKDLRRKPVLICFTISINYQVNEIPAHSLGTLPRSFRLLTAAGAARMPAARDAWQGTLSLALTSAISPSALFQHRPLEFVLSSSNPSPCRQSSSRGPIWVRGSAWEPLGCTPLARRAPDLAKGSCPAELTHRRHRENRSEPHGTLNTETFPGKPINST